MLVEATIKKIINKILSDNSKGIIDERNIQDSLLLIQEYLSEKKKKDIPLVLDIHSLNELHLFQTALRVSIDYFCSKYLFTLIIKEGKLLAIS